MIWVVTLVVLSLPGLTSRARYEPWRAIHYVGIHSSGETPDEHRKN